MHTETEIIDGYTVTIAQDDHPYNLLEEYVCEPPTLVWYEGFSEYNDPPNLHDLVRRIPDKYFERGNRVKLIKDRLNVSLTEFVEHLHYLGYGTFADLPNLSIEAVRETFADLLAEQVPLPQSSRYGWPTDYFETLEDLADLAGIPCLRKRSNGFSQGDSALVIIFATPEWRKMVGCPDEHVESNLQGTFDQYDAWAWGSVYGVSGITDPDGNEVDDASCWGFYGSDHEKSGLMDHARCEIELHKEWLAKEAEEATAMAARDIVTV